MLLKMLLVFVVSNFAAYVNAGLIAGHRSAAIGLPLVVQDPPQYEFQYAVHDAHTGDIKDQFEHRRGDYVTGRYSLIEPDGQRRIVEYTADPLLGFNAEVRRELPLIRSYTLGAQQTAAVAHQAVEAWPVPAQHR